MHWESLFCLHTQLCPRYNNPAMDLSKLKNLEVSLPTYCPIHKLNNRESNIEKYSGPVLLEVKQLLTIVLVQCSQHLHSGEIRRTWTLIVLKPLEKNGSAVSWKRRSLRKGYMSEQLKSKSCCPTHRIHHSLKK